MCLPLFLLLGCRPGPTAGPTAANNASEAACGEVAVPAAAPAPGVDAGAARALQLRGALLALKVAPACLGTQLFRGPGSAAEQAVVIALMQSDPLALVRARAAGVLGGLKGDPRPAFAALLKARETEHDATVAAAQFDSIANLLPSRAALRWDDGPTVNLVIHQIGLGNGSPRGSDAEAMAAARSVSASAGRALVVLGDILEQAALANKTHRPNVAADDAGATTTGDAASSDAVWQSYEWTVAGMLSNRDHRTPLDADWRVPLLVKLAQLFQNGRPNQDARGGLADSLVELLDYPAEPVRVAALQAMGALVDAAANVSDKQWGDLLPVLPPAAVGRLHAALVKTAADPAAPVRAGAATVLGQLAQHTGATIDVLVPLLKDADKQVRASATEALARKRAVVAFDLGAQTAKLKAGGAVALEAIAALSQQRTPEVLELLLQTVLMADKGGAAKVDAVPTGAMQGGAVQTGATPDQQQAEALALASSAARALVKFGPASVMPVLGKVASTDSDAARALLFTVLQEVNWAPSAAEQQHDVAAALTPALMSDNAQVRLLGASLIAQWRPYAVRPFADALVEAVVKEYLQVPAGGGKPAVQQSTNTIVFQAGGKPEWAMAPEMAAAVIAGNSGSRPAADALVKWMCSGRRLDPATVNISVGGGAGPNGQLRTMETSLREMGGAAALPLLAAIGKGGRKYCGESLLRAFMLSDLDQADAPTIDALLGHLRSPDAKVRRVMLVALADMTVVPDAAVVPLSALAARGDGVESVLARRALRLVAARRDAQAPAAPEPTELIPAFVIGESGSLGKASAEMPKALKQLQSDLAELPRADPERRALVMLMAGVMGPAAPFAVPALVSALQDKQALVREQAAFGLGRIASAQALSALEKARADPASTLARKAENAIARIKARASAPPAPRP